MKLVKTQEESKEVVFRDFGCAVKLGNTGELFAAPLSTTGEIAGDFYEVESPGTQGFLDKVNEAFGTRYRMSQFTRR